MDLWKPNEWTKKDKTLVGVILACLIDLSVTDFTGMPLHSHLGINPPENIEEIIARGKYLLSGAGMIYIGSKMVKEHWKQVKYYYNLLKKYDD